MQMNPSRKLCLNKKDCSRIKISKIICDLIFAQVGALWFYFFLCWLLIRMDARPTLFPFKSLFLWVFHHLWIQQQHEYQRELLVDLPATCFYFLNFFPGEPVMLFHMLDQFPCQVFLCQERQLIFRLVVIRSEGGAGQRRVRRRLDSNSPCSCSPLSSLQFYQGRLLHHSNSYIKGDFPNVWTDCFLSEMIIIPLRDLILIMTSLCQIFCCVLGINTQCSHHDFHNTVRNRANTLTFAESIRALVVIHGVLCGQSMWGVQVRLPKESVNWTTCLVSRQQGKKEKECVQLLSVCFQRKVDSRHYFILFF
jgi:hypothetical protein